MKVGLVGAGPGDPGLVTLKGKELIANADVIVYDALVNRCLLNFAKKDAELIYVGKIADKHALPQAQINQLLVEKALAGTNVVRLKGGDPYIFGRGGEEGEYLAKHGIPFEEVPGISSAVAAPAYAGIPLTHRDFVSSVTIITGHEKADKTTSSHNWEAYVQSGSTLVFLMGMASLPLIADNLVEAGMPETMPAAIIYRGTTPMQRVLVSTLAKLPKAAKAANFTNPSVIVVGKVVTLTGSLDWFGKKPLLGKTIVVTRSREQASELANALGDFGANVIECPGINIEPMQDYAACDAAIDKIGSYNWLAFTSVNGVKYFFERLALAGLDARSLGNAKIAAIGPATAAALAAKGISADIVPSTYVAESVVKAIYEKEGKKLNGMRILLPRAMKARNALPDGLAAAGAIVDVVPVYKAAPVNNCIDEARNALVSGSVDCITFASSSTVENFLAALPVAELKRHPDVILAAIGPITAKTLIANGLKAHVQPESFTIPALARAVADFFAQQGSRP